MLIEFFGKHVIKLLLQTYNMGDQCTCNIKTKINLDEPRYDQETYVGRAKHFLETTNPLNLFVTARKLEDAKCLVQSYK